jgi:8-oxo-dGTP pyrophosphatase MutT (NUDIX family)
MKVVYKGPVFSVEVERVRLPNGHEMEVATVRHPPSVVLIPVDDDGRVVLIKQYRPSVGQELWELPAGSLDPGESPEHAAARECEEEIGLAPSKVERLCDLYPTPGYCDERMIYFRVSGLHSPPPDSPHRPDEDEDIHPQAFSIAEAKAMIARGEIIDLKSAFGLTLTTSNSDV